VEIILQWKFGIYILEDCMQYSVATHTNEDSKISHLAGLSNSAM